MGFPKILTAWGYETSGFSMAIISPQMTVWSSAYMNRFGETPGADGMAGVESFFSKIWILLTSVILIFPPNSFPYGKKKVPLPISMGYKIPKLREGNVELAIIKKDVIALCWQTCVGRKHSHTQLGRVQSCWKAYDLCIKSPYQYVYFAPEIWFLWPHENKDVWKGFPVGLPKLCL